MLVLAALVLSTAALAVVLTVPAILADQVRIFTTQGGNPLWIFPGQADPGAYYATGLVNGELPQSMVQELARDHAEWVRHLVGKLHAPVTLDGRDFILTGVAPEVDPETKPKEIAPAGEVLLGSEVARKTARKPGDTVTLLGRSMTVAGVLPEQGTFDDLRIFARLSEVQTMVNKPGQVSMIEALPCKCTQVYARDVQRKLQAALGERARVVLFLKLAEMRSKTRRAVEHAAPVLIGLLGGLSGLVIGVTLYANVRSRRSELAILMALGFRPRHVAAMLLGKVGALGVAGGILGWLTGVGLISWLAPAFLEAPASFPPLLPVWSVIFAAALALIFSLPPLVLAALTDPARMLNEEPA